MWKEVKNPVVTLVTDPMNQWDTTKPDEILDWCGFLPMWVVDYGHTPVADTIKEHLAIRYGFPVHEMQGGEVKADHIYHYPQDPPLNPLLTMHLHNGAEFIQWQYGMCAMRDSQEADWYVTRMD